MKNGTSFICIYYKYILTFLVAFFAFSVGASVYITDDSTNNVEYRTEEENMATDQEIANLKMTISTFETVISTLQADNQKLSEIIQETQTGRRGWGLFGLLLLTSAMSTGFVLLLKSYKNKGVLNE